MGKPKKIIDKESRKLIQPLIDAGWTLQNMECHPRVVSPDGTRFMVLSRGGASSSAGVSALRSRIRRLLEGEETKEAKRK